MYIGGMMLNSYISISKNKLFVYSAIFVLLLLIICHILYFEKFAKHVLKNDLSAQKFHFIQQEGENIKVAAIGTSHMGDALRLDKNYFYNYARSSTWYPEVAYAKVSHLLENAPNLKVLLLEVDHISILAYDHVLHTTVPEQYLYLLKHVKKPLYEKNRLVNNDHKSIFFHSLQADVAPVIHRKYFQSYLIGRGKKKEAVSSWVKLTSKEKVKRAKIRTHSYRLDTPSKIDRVIHDYYCKAIREAKAKDIKVYLIFNPQSKEYFAEIHNENHVRVDNFVSSLAKENNITVLDYRHYFESDDSFFENQDHVNKRGAERLTKEVMKVIQNEL